MWQPNDPEVASSPATEARVARLLRFLGLAVRARQAVLGMEAVMKGIRSQNAKVVFVASDAGANSKKKVKDKCDYYQIPLIESIDRYLLGQACGRPNMVVVAVTDPGFAAKLLNYVGEFDGGDAFDKTSSI